MTRTLHTALLACLFALTGCAALPAPSAPRIDDPPLADYLHDLLCRLTRDCSRYAIVLLDDDTPQAELRPPGWILLRSGVLERVADQAELAFVLAHEIAHARLGHRPPRSLAARLPLELAADQAALASIEALGWPAGIGARTIHRLAPARSEAADEIARRLAALPADDGTAVIVDPDWQRLSARYRAPTP